MILLRNTYAIFINLIFHKRQDLANGGHNNTLIKKYALILLFKQIFYKMPEQPESQTFKFISEC